MIRGANMIEIKLIKIESLTAYKKNSKTHSETQIAQIQSSIKEFGFFEPIHVDENKTILSGHARVQALKGMGEKMVPSITLVGLSPEEKSKIVIAANKIQDNGAYDMKALHQEINFILSQNPDSDLSSVGFSNDELESLLDMDFTPFLEPFKKSLEISQKDMDKAQNKLSESIDHIQQDKSDEGIEVVCPYCASSFSYSGY